MGGVGTDAPPRAATRFDYNTPPAVPAATFVQVANTLARWLPSQADGAPLAGWDDSAWRAAEYVACWQNALPWLVQRVRETNVPVPADVWARLLMLDGDSRARTERVLDEVAVLLDALRADGVDAIPLKGAVLAPLYYPDPFARPLGDVDVLVRPADLARGVAVMRRLGYTFYGRDAKHETWLKGTRDRRNPWSPANVRPVDMHHTARQEYAGLEHDLSDALWQGSAWQPLWNGVQALVPSPALLLHHVCAHATRDLLIRRAKLAHLADVSRIAARMTAADWQAFGAGVPPFAARLVYPALAMTRRYVPAAVIPERVLQSLRQHIPPRLLAWLEQTEWGGASEMSPARRWIVLGMWRMLARSPGEQARMLARLAFPRRWDFIERYPRLVASPAWPLCYLLVNIDRVRKAVGQ